MKTTTSRHTAQRPAQATGEPAEPFQTVNPLWLLKAIGFTLLAALVCGYLTLCLLFYQGQWQLVLHPSLRDTPDLALAGLAAQPVRFDAAETGSPRLSGLLFPAGREAHYGAYTVLYLRGGDSSLAHNSDDQRNLEILRGLGLGVFAFDYRGYGLSDPTHPSQVRMTEDSQAAFRYLTETRAIPASHLVLYGTGTGASLATAIAKAHPEIPAIILSSPGEQPVALALADPRTRFLPVRALFHEDFSLEPLATLATPKLLISYLAVSPHLPEAFASAANPKMSLEADSNDLAAQAAAIRRFLDENLTLSSSKVKE